MGVSIVPMLRFTTPAILAGVLAGSCLAETTPAADAVVAQCARLFDPAPSLAQGLDAIPGLTPVPLSQFEPEGAHGRALRMALAYNSALNAIVGTDLVAPEDQLLHEFRRVEAESPWLFSRPGLGGGVMAYTDAEGTLFVIDRAYTTGRQGRRTTRCLVITPEGVAPLTPNVPDAVTIEQTPSLSRRGFSVSAVQGRIPFSDDPELSGGSAGYSMVTMPIPTDTPLAELAGIGGVTIFRQSTPNRRSE